MWFARPAGLVEDGAEHQFCCSGCRVAYEVIRGHGLDGYYDIKSRVQAPEQAARVSGKTFSEFDDPAFHRLYCRTLPSGLETVELCCSRGSTARPACGWWRS